MSFVSADWYLTLKSLHIIAIICWMAGLLYLPRLFVYHATNINKKEMDATFKVMEHKLYKYIMLPSMLFSIIFGALLIISIGGFSVGKWLHIKLTCVFLLIGVHFLFGYHKQLFVKNKNTFSIKYFRIINEAPTVLMIIIVILAVIKPW